MAEKYLRRKDGSVIKWGDTVTVTGGKEYEVRGWTEPNAVAPLGWVKLFDRQRLHDNYIEFYPTAINAHFN